MADEATPTPAPNKSPLKDIEIAEDDEDEETKVKKSRERTFWTRLWQGLAIGSLGLNLAAIAIEQSAVTIVAGILACIVAPIVIKVQKDLLDTDTLRRVQNLLRQEVNRFQAENSKLTEEINQLETQVSGLKENEDKLQSITEKQGTSVDSLVTLVKENQRIIDGMNKALECQTLQDILSIVLQSDFDQSFCIEKQEVDVLLLRLKVDPRVTVDEKRLRKRVEGGKSLGIAEIIKDFLGDAPEEERMFRLTKKGSVAVKAK